ncbi:unnamed protein product [Oppiella nova]|uniref:GT23 domain-containing protein n=1 Tax=Oppiella nova TaxID=334625 RepID=A0A7R9M8J7_9ACAR|nr:unnamed protein product [Oppiella nova]CAG2172204.1 unnamed protein product [Oppiella nova]
MVYNIDLRPKRITNPSLLDYTNIVIDTINKMQNPPNCRLASKFVCILKIKCGFGCTMHHYAYCLILALKLNRTLIIPETIANTYTSHMKMLFRPISDTCLDSNGDNSITWEGMSDQTHHYYQVIDFYFGYDSKGYLQDLKNLTQIIRQLQSLSTEPIPLFIGHIIRKGFNGNTLSLAYMCDGLTNLHAFNNIRNSYESIRNLIVEILVLSECDYIVCTFSSNICRLVFELRMSRINNSLAFQSLDRKYYYRP